MVGWGVSVPDFEGHVSDETLQNCTFLCMVFGRILINHIPPKENTPYPLFFEQFTSENHNFEEVNHLFTAHFPQQTVQLPEGNHHISQFNHIKSHQIRLIPTKSYQIPLKIPFVDRSHGGTAMTTSIGPRVTTGDRPFSENPIYDDMCYI